MQKQCSVYSVYIRIPVLLLSNAMLGALKNTLFSSFLVVVGTMQGTTCRVTSACSCGE